MYFQRLEDLRVDNDKTQIEIAEYLNLNRNVYWRYEKGEREILCGRSSSSPTTTASAPTTCSG